jgi:hypothetical protein
MLLAVELNPRGDFSGSSVHAALRAQGFLAGCYPAGHVAGTGLRFDPAFTIEEQDVARLLTCLEALLV